MQADLGYYRDHNRLLVLFAPRATDPRLVRQNAAFKDEATRMRERQLVRIIVMEDSAFPAGIDAVGLRKKYGVGPDAFAALLVGKDGTVAYRAKEPVTPKRIYALIDAMPMRRAEMRRKGG